MHKEHLRSALNDLKSLSTDLAAIQATSYSRPYTNYNFTYPKRQLNTNGNGSNMQHASEENLRIFENILTH